MMSKTPEQWARSIPKNAFYPHLTYEEGLVEVIEPIRQAMQQAREEALEEAAALCDAASMFYAVSAPALAATNQSRAADIRALKNKESQNDA
jgi:hypothetical protein